MRRGLTLVEVVMALTLAAVVVLMGATAFRAGLFGRESLKQRAAQTTAMRRAYEIISRDMHSAIVPPDDSGMEFGSSTEGTSSVTSEVFSFASTVGEPLLVTSRAANETSLIRYEVALDPVTNRPTLWRYETPYPVPEGTSTDSTQDVRATPLLEGVAEVHYQFLDAAQQQSLTSWEGQSGLPSAVYMQVFLEPAGSGSGASSGPVAPSTVPSENWTFYLPASKYAVDEAEAAAAAEEAGETGTGTGTGAAGGTGAGGTGR